MFRHANVFICVLCASCGSPQCFVLQDLQFLLMVVEDESVDHKEEACSRADLMSVSFCLPHPVAVRVCINCRGLCACTEML